MNYARLGQRFPEEAERRRVVENLVALREQLDGEVPPKDAEDNLLLATWNLRDLGKPVNLRRGYGDPIPESLGEAGLEPLSGDGGDAYAGVVEIFERIFTPSSSPTTRRRLQAPPTARARVETTSRTTTSTGAPTSSQTTTRCGCA